MEKTRNQWQSFVECELLPIVSECEASGVIPKHLFAKAGKNGLLQLGDSGFTHMHSKVVIECLMKTGSQSLAVFFSAYKVIASLLTNYGNNNLHQTILNAIFSGDSIVPLGITEPNAGSSLRVLETIATEHDDHFIVSGVKDFICSVNVADYLLTLVNTGSVEDPEYTLLLIPTVSSGFEYKKRTMLGWRGLNISTVYLRDVIVNKNNVVGQRGCGVKYLSTCLSMERYHLSLIALNSAKIAFEKAVKYANNRTIKNQSLIKKQVIAHRLARIKSELSVSENAMRSVSKELELCDSSYHEQIAGLKYFMTEQAQKITDESVHIHGATGCIDDTIVERLWRDCRLLKIGGGTSEIMLEIISRNLDS